MWGDMISIKINAHHLKSSAHGPRCDRMMQLSLLRLYALYEFKSMMLM